jgi:signal transduction histidine kinase
MKKTNSLHQLFKRQIARWTIYGFVGSAGLAMVLVVGFGVMSTEHQLKITAQSVVKAFRDQILSGDVHQNEIQIRDALHLAKNESVIIRSPNFKQIYTLEADSESGLTVPSCSTPEKVCWHLGKYQVSILVPIYYNPARKDLFGYAELNVSPQIDFTLLTLLFVAICAGSIIQGFGLGSRLGALAGLVALQMKDWAEHINTDPKAPVQAGSLPFDELNAMQAALGGLNQEISRLEEQARDSAKLSIIRGITHDILSPVSQLQKYLKMMVLYTNKGESPPIDFVEAVQRSLNRLTAIAQQTKILRAESDLSQNIRVLDIANEAQTLLTDLQMDGEIESKKIELSAQTVSPSILANVNADDYARITDNLVRNAVHASLPSGKVHVITTRECGHPVLVVRDEGVGISEEIQSKIFDLNFTTRPGSGTGLGLAIVKQLCERNGASIQFKSKLGEGTEFRVAFKSAEKSLEVNA